MKSNLLQKTSSVAFRDGSTIAIQRALEELERQATIRVHDGFSEMNFTLGVMNSLLVTYVFSAFPQHLWLLYLFEAAIIFPLIIKFLMQSTPERKIAYLLDFCWVMNIAGVLSLFFLFAGRANVSNELRYQVFLAAYGTACGPLLGATGLLSFVSLIFHHIHSMASVFIHFFPPLLFYILRWQGDLVTDAWPNTFHLDYDVVFFPNRSMDGVSHNFTGTVFGNTVIAYFCWFIPYCCWQWFIGLDLPTTSRKTLETHNEGMNHDDGGESSSAPSDTTAGTCSYSCYDTVFHKNMRHGLCVKIGSVFWGRSVEESQRQMALNQFEKRDFVVYMTCHVLSALTSLLVLGYLCHVSKYIHGFFLVALLVICTWRGARRYTYYGTQMYVDILKKSFEAELNHIP
mmetsp:Transcript_14516/g.27309  ORF Transcript_14516/g.27309 Transcript_14516/m.27309 type:complete len:400 (-) Transcript_14516:149-1348(-)